MTLSPEAQDLIEVCWGSKLNDGEIIIEDGKVFYCRVEDIERKAVSIAPMWESFLKEREVFYASYKATSPKEADGLIEYWSRQRLAAWIPSFVTWDIYGI